MMVNASENQSGGGKWLPSLSEDFAALQAKSGIAIRSIILLSLYLTGYC